MKWSLRENCGLYVWDDQAEKTVCNLYEDCTPADFVGIGGVYEPLPSAETNGKLIAAIPEMLEALDRAAEIISLARQFFPKTIKNPSRFQLENTCATIGKALHKARGAE